MLEKLCMSLSVLIWLVAVAPSAWCEYEAVEVKDGCMVSGKVEFVGKIPEPAMLVVDKDRHVCGMKTRPSKKLIVDKDTRGIKNAVVYIVGMTKGKNFEAKWHFVLDQKECEFVPHVQVIPANSTLEIRNSDPMAHNIHAFSLKNATFNESIPSRGRPIAKSFGLKENIKVGCDRHGWMRAWVVVREDPYYCITGADGTFEITGILPGKYKIAVWHEAYDAEVLAATEKEVSLAPDQETRLSFKLPLD